MIIDAMYVSIWDDGREMSSPCKFDVASRRVFEIEGTEDSDVEVVEFNGHRFSAKDGIFFDH